MFPKVWRIALYLVILCGPVILAAMTRQAAPLSMLAKNSLHLALFIYMLLFMQVVLAGRFKWIEQPFGLDRLIAYHRKSAVFLTLLIILHPLLLSEALSWKLITSLHVPPPVWLGRSALVLLIVNVLGSLYQRKNPYDFETWRGMHDLLALLIVVLIFLHGLALGPDLKFLPLKVIWIGTFICFVTLFAYHRFIRPAVRKKHHYTVTAVVETAPKAWTIQFIPPLGESLPAYLPGQFHFLTFHRAAQPLPVEEHHWTISSSPTEAYLSSTIKALGDFTATMGATKPGDTVTVDGPYGRFSYLLHPDEKELVFIVGGIGITPVRSMLKHLHDQGSQVKVVLLYANNDEYSIAFKDELERIATSGSPPMTLIHVLSRPGSGWTGETGIIDKDKIGKYCQDSPKETGYYLCGPQPMIKSIIKILRGRGIPRGRIHTELFSFLGR